MAFVDRKMNKKTMSIIVTILVAVLAIISIGSIIIFANENNKNGVLLSCSFDGSTYDDIKQIEGAKRGITYYDNALRINNGHKTGNSMKNSAMSYVQYDPIKKLETSDFTISFDYFPIEPTDTFSSIISTGEFGKGINIFNKNGIGISIGEYFMKSDMLTQEERKKGNIRLDYNIINDGKKHSVLITVDRDSDFKLYIDGIFIDKVVLPANMANLVNDTFVIGANSSLQYGSEDMLISNLNVYSKICDNKGNDLFDEYEWLVIVKKARKVLSDYSDLASKALLDELKSSIENNKPTTKQEVTSCVKKVDEDIKKVVSYAKTNHEVMNYQIVSDTHLMRGNYNPKAQLEDALKDIGKLFPDTSALVVPGDLTDNGWDDQYEQYYDALKKYNTAPYTMSITGNHESSYNDDDPKNPSPIEADNARYLKWENDYRRFYGEEELDKVYFDKWVKGYHFIGLASEKTPDHDTATAVFSPTQMQFLRDKLKEAEQGHDYDPKKPIFVFVHQALNDTVYNSDVFGVGVNSNELKEIFSKYPQVVYVSGHAHNGCIGMEAIYDGGFGTLIDVPCLRANEVFRYHSSIGYTISLYDNGKTIFTPIDFTHDDVIYDMTIVIDRALSETKTDIYDYTDFTVNYNGNDINNNQLCDYNVNLDNSLYPVKPPQNSTYLEFEGNKEIVYSFKDSVVIDGLRIGTTYYNKPSNIMVAFSENGNDFTQYQTVELDKKVDLQKIFFQNAKNIKKMKIKFSEKVNISSLIPTAQLRQK